MLTRRSEMDLRLAVLVAVRSPADFAHADVARVLECSPDLVAEIAESVKEFRDPTVPMSQSEIARVLKVSRSAVHQIEHTALMRLRHPKRMKILREMMRPEI